MDQPPMDDAPMDSRDASPPPGETAVGGGRPGLVLRYAALSDVGRVRKDNQDSAFAGEHLLVIADGVGGAARGDVASSTAVHALRRLDAPPPADLLEALAGAVHRAHDRIAELVEQDSSLDGTSTTVTAALFDGARIGVAHIGDSRGYLLRDGVLSQLTRDHTFVQSLVDEGRITEVESRTHPHRNLILRAVDGVRETDPDLFTLDVAPGDRLLLCSDGASGVLDPDRLADILGTGSVDFAAVELVRASLEAGSTDNVTCVVADVVERDDPDVAGGSGAPGPRSAPLIVGAAAADDRSPGSQRLFRGHRGGDTGELEPVPGEAGTTERGAGTATGTLPATGPRAGAADTDPEELRYAPLAPRRGRWLRGLAALLVVALVVGVAGLLGYQWSQDQYYVAGHEGRVAIYRGVQVDLPGVTMSRVAEDTDVTVAALRDDATEQVAGGIAADSLADARDIVTRLTRLARVCPAPTPSASPTARPGAGRTPAAAGSPRSTPGATPRPTPSPTAGATPTGGASPSAGGASPSAGATLRPPDCVEATP